MAKPIENTERISTYVTPEQLDFLRVKAKEKGMTVSGYIRMLIIEGVLPQGQSASRQAAEPVDINELFASLPGVAIKER